MLSTSRVQTFGVPWLLQTLMLIPILTLGALTPGCRDDRPNPFSDAGSAADDSDAGPVTSACAASTGPIDPSALIDNFEGGSSNLPMIAGRIGSWYAEGDATATAIIRPSGLATPEIIPGGRCDSRHALRVTGTGFLDWGSEISAPLDYGMNDAGVSGYLPFNGSQYTGVTFFARIGDTSTNVVHFAISDEYARPEAGLCVIGGGMGSGCYDSFAIDLSPFIGTDWRQFNIPFAGLSQRNFGLHSDAIDTSMLYDVEFIFPPNTVFDLWVDDISFY